MEAQVQRPKEGSISLGMEVTGSCDSQNIGARNQAPRAAGDLNCGAISAAPATSFLYNIQGGCL